MLINKNIIPKLLEYNIPIYDNIDQTMKNKLFSNINVYICNPPIINHNNNIESFRRLLSNKSGITYWQKNIQNNIITN